MKATELTDRELLELITDRLRRIGEIILHVPGGDQAGIERVRCLGRQAGRDLGWHVLTSATDPGQREDGISVVALVVEDDVTEHQERLKDHMDEVADRLSEAHENAVRKSQADE